MKKDSNSINGGVQRLGLGLIVCGLLAACGGGGGGSAGTATATAVSSYIADQQAGGFVGSWVYVGGASSVANAGVNTLTATGTANT